VIERDDGFVDADVMARYLDPRRSWSTLDRAAFRALRGRVLDVGCGGGRIALAVQERGGEALAIDVSPGAIEVCLARGVREAAVRSAVSIEASVGSFDSIALFGNNLGLLEGRRKGVALLRRFRRVLEPHGRLVGIGMDPTTTEDPRHLAYQARNRERGRMAGQIRLRVRYGHLTTPWFDYLFATLDELGEMAADAGWSIRDVLRDEGPGYAVVLQPA
jgi:SAM-dependent methyltransferase